MFAFKAVRYLRSCQCVPRDIPLGYIYIYIYIYLLQSLISTEESMKHLNGR